MINLRSFCWRRVVGTEQVHGTHTQNVERRSKTSNWCFECTHGNNEHGGVVLSHLLSRPRGDLSHLGGATTQKGWMGRRFTSVPLGWGDGQRDRPTTGSPSVPWLWGQRLHDSDETLKAFLSRKLADVLQSKQRNWVTFRRAQLLGSDRMPTYFFWRLVCLVCVTAKRLSAAQLSASQLSYRSLFD